MHAACRARVARPALAAVLVTAALAAASVACGSDQTPPSAAATAAAADRPTTTEPTTSTASSADRAAATTPPSTTAPPATAPSPEAEVIAAYQAFWDTWLRANDPPNPDHPDLARWYTGPALERARAEIAKNKAQGVVIRTSPASDWEIRPTDIQLAGSTATLRACMVDGALILSAASGSVLDSEVVASDLAAELRQDSRGLWQVWDNTLANRREVDSCD